MVSNCMDFRSAEVVLPWLQWEKNLVQSIAPSGHRHVLNLLNHAIIEQSVDNLLHVLLIKGCV